jgi:hypothetical protein
MVDTTGSMGDELEYLKVELKDMVSRVASYGQNLSIRVSVNFYRDEGDEYIVKYYDFREDIDDAVKIIGEQRSDGGGDYPEDYALLWYFLAKHTDTDSMKKRNKKGYAFTIGDAPNHDMLYRSDIKEIFGDEDKDYEYLKVAEMCEEKYNLFHIMINASDNVIPGRTIYIDKHDIDYLPEIIITVICKIEGVNPAEILGDLDKNVEKIVNRAIKDISFGENIEI